MKKANSANVAVSVSLALVFIFFVFFQTQLSSILILNSSPPSQAPRNLHFPPPPTEPSPNGGDGITCDRSHKSYDLCSVDGPVVLDPAAATFYLTGARRESTQPISVETIRPYPRKAENHTMSRIKELTLTSGVPPPACRVRHNVPAMVFSAGGYTGNFFHDFNDGFIPLFITINGVFGEGEDFILVVSKAREWWLSKYGDLLRGFSRHPIISLENETATHCFTSVAVGLVSHGFMTVDPNSAPHRSFVDFHHFLNRAYRRYIPVHATPRGSSKPRLVFVTRTGAVARALLNQAEVKRTMEDIGFEVIMFEPKASTPLAWAAKLLGSSHAMVGVHGAALTHFVFLRPGAVLGQVVPLGVEWAAEVCFGAAGRSMGLEYMEYRIAVEESDLAEKYGREETVIRDPAAFRGEKWSNMEVYLKQNVRLDLRKFSQYLEGVYQKAKRFMDREG